MADLALIPLVPGPMTENLTRALAETGEHPWALDRFMTQMKGIRPGVHIAFVHSTSPSGGPLGRAGPVPIDAKIGRVVLGKVTRGIAERASPYFDGFPHEFWYELICDEALDPPRPLPEAADFLNATISGLDIDGGQLRELLSNARSSKVGMYVDGGVRKAAYFRDFDEPPSEVPHHAGPTEHADLAGLDSEPSTPFGALADRFVAGVASSGLVFADLNEDLPRAFLAGLVAKRFAILTGLSGSGKTQLARALGRWFGLAPDGRARYLVVPVRADWTSPEPLLGYEDLLLPPSAGGQRGWNVPPALEFVLRAADDPEHPWLLVLDEMNLAHVERYFADVLSGIESGEPILPNLSRSPDSTIWYPSEEGPHALPLPPNLFIVGTVNVDETTYQFSPKVLDRAFTFEFRVSSSELDRHQRALTPMSSAADADLFTFQHLASQPDAHLDDPHPDAASLYDGLTALHEALALIGLEFGHRSLREAMRFAASLHQAGVTDQDAAWDWVVMTKVLPRVHGSRRRLEDFLIWLGKEAESSDPEKPPRPLVDRKVKRMLESLRDHQFAGFAE